MAIENPASDRGGLLDAIVSWSLDNRAIVIVVAIISAGLGLYSAFHLPIDAFPDTTPVQVQINTVAPALAPSEIEQQITFPVEQAMSGLPGLETVRSISKFGLSQVTVIFDDSIDIYFARQLIAERLQTVSLPKDRERPQMGPVSTGLGEVYHYLVTSKKRSLRELTTLHDWVVKPRMRSVPGVAEVNTWGGERKQYHVIVNLDRLTKFELTLDAVSNALRKNNLNVGGGNLSQGGELQLLRGIALTTGLEQIRNIVIKAHDGTPIRIRDIAQVKIGHEIKRAAVTANGQGETVLGLGFMLMGQNSHDVTKAMAKRMENIKKDLPEDVEIKTVYERTDLVDNVIETVKKNLLEGAILVVAILFIFLGNLRAGLIVVSAIPLSMLFAFNGMLQFGIAGSLMSLGAIDFGLIVDSSVIMVENSVRRLSLEQDSPRSVLEIVRDASLEVRRPTMFGELIIMIVYLPILTLEGVEGKLFRPMALTVIFALAGSLILSLTLMPVLTSLLLPRKIKEKENVLVRAAKWLYRPLVRFAMRGRYFVIVFALALVGLASWFSQSIGAEFVPRLSEMGIVINTVRLSGISLEESVRYGTKLEQLILKEFPDEVENVWTRTGTPEVATDPMGIELSDVFVTLKPRDQWTRATTQEDLMAAMRQEFDGLPGMRMLYTQPIEMRVNEMIAGIRGDLGIKIFGDDLRVLKAKGAELERILRAIPGAVDPYTEQITGQPVLEVVVKQDEIARYGIPARDVLDLIEAIGGIEIGEIREDQRRFNLLIRLGDRFRHDPDAVRDLTVLTVDGKRVPLSRLTDIRSVEGPSTITREWQRRRIVVQCNVSGRDVSGFVAEVRQRLETELDLPDGYHIEYGGQFEQLQRAQLRLMIVVPLALAMIFFLLYVSTHSVWDTLIIFTGAPFATIGGIFALWIREMPFTISAGVGFVAVCGVAMLNGLVLVETIKTLIGRGCEFATAIEEGALQRLRPVLMTALVAGLGFVPMALNTGVGSEIQRPLATVVVGGVISDCLLTLLALPALYFILGSSPQRAATIDSSEAGVTRETVH
ncbi:MAG: CusA/CzcA family heavy metal efflux RND transporter [Planctomycetota bacterium]|nr:CusA/CzcA family heavy metal efflux RND transporter [Planctomycetota bacterium]